jgi:hypothetical protein
VAETLKYDLHGVPVGEVTEGFDDEVGYLERVTITSQPLAEEKFCEAWRVDPEEIDVQPIHMRHVTEDPDPIVVPDIPCWLECEADHPDAVPFWAVKP